MRVFAFLASAFVAAFHQEQTMRRSLLMAALAAALPLFAVDGDSPSASAADPVPNAAGGASSDAQSPAPTSADAAAAGAADDAGNAVAPESVADASTVAGAAVQSEPVVAGEPGNVDTGASTIVGQAPVDSSSSIAPSIDSAAIADVSGTQATGVEGGDVPNVAASPAESQPESVIASSATNASPVDVTPAAAPVDVAPSSADFAAATLPTALAEAPADVPAAVPAAPVAIAPAADVTNSAITPLDGAAAQPTVDEHEHPLHIAITRIEVYSENLGTEFMMQLKRLLSDVRDEARKVL